MNTREREREKEVIRDRCRAMGRQVDRHVIGAAQQHGLREAARICGLDEAFVTALHGKWQRDPRQFA